MSDGATIGLMCDDGGGGGGGDVVMAAIER